MNRILVSLALGFAIFFIGTMVTGNALVGLFCGIPVAIILSIITDQGDIDRQQRKRESKKIEREEERRWRRRGYHDSAGRKIAQHDYETKDW